MSKQNKIDVKPWSNGRTLNEKVGYDIRKFKFDYMNKPYLCGVYLASYLSGIPLRNLTESDDTPKIITSIARYHIYYQIKRFIAKPELINYYRDKVVGVVRDHIPTRQVPLKTVSMII